MRLSLVVAAPVGDDGLAFFEGFAENAASKVEGIEVLVTSAAPASLGGPPAGVKILTAEGPSIFQLWGTGVRQASGRYIALLDTRCPLEPEWLDSVLAGIKSGAPAYFGPVDCAWEPGDAQALGYLVEYVQFHPPLCLELRETPGVNAVVARELAQHPAVLQADGFVKTRLLRLLQDRGLPAPSVLPQAMVRYQKRYRWAEYLTHRYGHGRCYGAGRPLPGSAARLRALVVTPLLPLVRTWRIFGHSRRTPYRGAFWRLLPQVLIAETAWSVGEFTGYLLGAGGWWARLK